MATATPELTEAPRPADAPEAPPPEPVEDRARRARRHALGLFSGFALLAATNAIAIAVAAPWPHGGLAVRLLHHGFDMAEHLGVGALAALVVGLWLYAVRAPLFVHVAAYAAAATAAFVPVLGSDLDRQALVVFDGRFEGVLYPAFLVLTGLGVPAAHLLGTWLGRYRRLRFLPLAVAAGGVVTSQLIVRDDYAGLHGAIGWGAATLAGATLAPVAERLVDRLALRARHKAFGLSLAVVALAGLFVRPPNSLRLVLFHEPGALAPWILASAHWPLPDASAPRPTGPWFSSRKDAPPAPPTKPPLIADNPVVVLVTIDATRADDVQDPKHEAMFPTFAELRRTGAELVHATSPGGQTAVSLSTLFSGRYFTGLYWGMHGEGVTRFAYPADDDTERFPALLTKAGVKTVGCFSVNFLANDFGVARGFAEQHVIPPGRQHAMGRDMVNAVEGRLRRAGNGPLFLYTHLMEPHAPYDRGKLKTGPAHDRYLSEIAVADAQLARIVKMLDSPRYRDRSVLIVSADHGEAFGEHGTHEHTKTLYDELLRVPLFIHGAGIAPRRIEERVGLIDVGATVLDLFGVDTPGPWLGQSLVPLLQGRPEKLDRPLGAEGRLRRVLYTRDGYTKVIEDPRRKTLEVYDLHADPGETVNLFDRDPSAVAADVVALRTFFAAHEVKRPGYSPPYKP